MYIAFACWHWLFSYLTTSIRQDVSWWIIWNRRIATLLADSVLILQLLACIGPIIDVWIGIFVLLVIWRVVQVCRQCIYVITLDGVGWVNVLLPSACSHGNLWVTQAHALVLVEALADTVQLCPTGLGLELPGGYHLVLGIDAVLWLKLAFEWYVVLLIVLCGLRTAVDRACLLSLRRAAIGNVLPRWIDLESWFGISSLRIGPVASSAASSSMCSPKESSLRLLIHQMEVLRGNSISASAFLSWSEALLVWHSERQTLVIGAIWALVIWGKSALSH